MNKCYQCVNHHMTTTQKGLERHNCSCNKNIVVFGKMGNEPIVDNCGQFVQLKEYRK